MVSEIREIVYVKTKLALTNVETPNKITDFRSLVLQGKELGGGVKVALQWMER